jgi:hypothetical protein
VASAALSSLFLDEIPHEHVGKGLSLLNAATTGVGLLSPIYGSQVFTYFGGSGNKGLVASIHYFVLLIFSIVFKGGKKIYERKISLKKN